MPLTTTSQDGVTIQLVGDKELLAKLERLDRKDSRRAISRATRAAAKRIQPVAKRLAPKRTGALRRAIRVRAADKKLKRALRLPARKYIGAVCRIGKGFFKGETFYGGFVEWGWKTRGGRVIPGKLFMQRAAEKEGLAAANEATEIVRQEIEAAATR